MRRRLPAVHPLTATTLLGLGELLLDRGAADRAEPLLREALAMRQTVLPPEHPHVAEAQHFLGTALLADRRYVEAERYLLASLARLRAAFGNRDSRTRAALTSLVLLYEASGQPRQAASHRARLDETRP
jgi:tetratricopeptide (TPR) repeat protein